MFTIHRIADNQYEVLIDGERVGELHTSYSGALTYLGGLLELAQTEGAANDSDPEDGLLPETWEDVAGICFSQPTGDGRDFTGCAWTARDPAVSLLPLMFQTVNDFGHMSAELAGYMETIEVGDTPKASGRFYDSDTGRAARDVLLGGRMFGVSVDPGAVEAEWECVEEDGEGYCIDGKTTFTAYQIIGLTMTPFPAFEAAAIRLAGAATDSGTTDTADDTTESAVTAAGRGTATKVRRAPAAVDLAAPPRDWLETPEPELGKRYVLGSMGDEWLVEQGETGALAMPLHITDDGRVLGNLAYWGQCHIGYGDTCVSPPSSPSNYAGFHVGEVVCADGSRLPVGALTASCDHAIRGLRAAEAQDHYAHNGLAWANVRINDGVYGPWVCGALRPGVSRDQLNVLRGGALSGDWREINGTLELIAALAVTTPGFPIAREALVASGLSIRDAPRQQAVIGDGGQVRTLVASGIVRRCPDCARRAAARADTERVRPGATTAALERRLAEMAETMSVLERRTRHLVTQQAKAMAINIKGSPNGSES